MIKKVLDKKILSLLKLSGKDLDKTSPNASEENEFSSIISYDTLNVKIFQVLDFFFLEIIQILMSQK